MNVWEIWSDPEEELRIIENKLPKRILGFKEWKVTGGGENCIMTSFVIRALLRIL
jgi:hypothetical protein